MGMLHVHPCVFAESAHSATPPGSVLTPAVGSRGWRAFIFVLLTHQNKQGTCLPVRDVSMTLSQVELALLGGLPLRKLDQLIASGRAPIYARPPSRRVAFYTLHEAVMLATGLMLHER